MLASPPPQASPAATTHPSTHQPTPLSPTRPAATPPPLTHAGLFKDGDYSRALACWARVRNLYSQMGQAKGDERLKFNFPPPEEVSGREPSIPCSLGLLSAAAYHSAHGLFCVSGFCRLS